MVLERYRQLAVSGSQPLPSVDKLTGRRPPRACRMLRRVYQHFMGDRPPQERTPCLPGHHMAV